MIGEVWRVVPSAPQFMASSEGRIMVAPYLAPLPNGGVRQYGGEPHFGVWSKTDERFITVYKKKTFKVARLICEAFYGSPPDGKPICMHLNENPANNRASNLMWGSQKENLNAPIFKEYQRKKAQSANPWLEARVNYSETIL